MLATSRTLTEGTGAGVATVIFGAFPLRPFGPPPPCERGRRRFRIHAFPRLRGKVARSAGRGQLSFEQSRGVIFFSVAYLDAVSLTSGAMTASSAVYQSEMTFHFLPSHWWTRLRRVPSSSEHDTLIGPIMPS